MPLAYPTLAISKGYYATDNAARVTAEDQREKYCAANSNIDSRIH